MMSEQVPTPPNSKLRLNAKEKANKVYWKRCKQEATYQSLLYAHIANWCERMGRNETW